MTHRGARQRPAEGQLTGVAILALILTAVLVLLPLLLCSGGIVSELTEPEQAEPGQEARETGGCRDRGRAVRLLQKDGTVHELTLEDYLWGVVAAEMPASFQLEALKAQVCAARTYTIARQTDPDSKHPQADICADSSCCQAYVERSMAEARWGLNAAEYAQKLEMAVAETDGLGILYEGTPIQALFFSSAAGRTVDAVEVWGNGVDYLRGVDSPEGAEVPNYHSQVILTPEEVRGLVLGVYPGADLTGKPEGWFSHRVENSAGGVASMVVGGVTLTGSQLRGLFSLRSTYFTVDWDGTAFTFSVTGYGHGVGMSQYGANAMAGEGKNFREILTWYYTGTEVAPLWE